jgi:hypothetical protein
LLGLARSVRRDFSPGGQAHAIQQNYSDYQTWLENQRKRLNEGLIQPFQLNSASEYVLGNYSGIGEGGPNGIFNRISGPEIEQYVDINDEVSKYAEEVVASSLESGQWVDRGDGIFKKTSTGLEAITPQEIQYAVLSGVAGNQNYQSYVRQMIEFGADPDIIATQLDSAINRVASSFSYEKRTYDEDIRFDPVRAVYAKAALDAERESYSYLPPVQQREERSLSRPTGKLKSPFLEGVVSQLGFDGVTGRTADIDQWATSPEAQSEYGVLLNETYQAVKANYPEWNQFTNDEKFEKVQERYEENYRAMSARRPYIVNFGDDTIQDATQQNLRSNRGALYDWYYVNSEGEISDKSNMKDVTDTLGWGDVVNNVSTDQLANEAWIVGRTQTSSGLPEGLMVTLPGHTDGYWIMSGADAQVTELDQQLIQITEPLANPYINESQWTEIGALSEGGAQYKLVKQNQYNEEGNFSDFDQYIFRREPILDDLGRHIGWGPEQLMVDYSTGQPWTVDYLQAHNNNISQFNRSPNKAGDHISR